MAPCITAAVLMFILGLIGGMFTFAIYSTRRDNKFYDRGYKQAEIDGELH